MNSALQFLAIKGIKDGTRDWILWVILREQGAFCGLWQTTEEKGDARLPRLQGIRCSVAVHWNRMQSQVQEVCRGKRWSVHAHTFEKRFAALSLTGVKLL